jgi:hypothetical protein
MGCGGTAVLFCGTSPLSLPWAGQGFNAGHSCESFFQKKGCTGGIGFVKFVEKGNGNVENAAGSSFIEENVAQH